MSKKEKKKNEISVNFLDYVPVHTIEWDTDQETGKVYLIKERSKNKILKKIIHWIGKDQNFHIRLDELGSDVWKAVDGKRNVKAIADYLQENSEKELVQANERVSFFLGMMKKNDFVELYKKVGDTGSQ
jgi:Coenzyme PQQ synthesis protein D (PqqD)